MSCWTKPELENMLEDVVNELDLSAEMIEKHGQEGTAPAELVRLVLEEKDKQIFMLKRGFKQIELKDENKQLHIHDVVKSLPNKNEMTFEDWLMFKKITKKENSLYKLKGVTYNEDVIKKAYKIYLM